MQTLIKHSGICQASLLQNKEIIVFQKKFLKHKKHALEISNYAKALSDPTRSKIITLLFIFDSLCVCDIANILKISIASSSQHLRKLNNLQFISFEKRAQTVFYILNKKSKFGLFCSKILII